MCEAHEGDVGLQVRGVVAAWESEVVYPMEEEFDGVGVFLRESHLTGLCLREWALECDSAVGGSRAEDVVVDVVGDAGGSGKDGDHFAGEEAGFRCQCV